MAMSFMELRNLFAQTNRDFYHNDVDTIITGDFADKAYNVLFLTLFDNGDYLRCIVPGFMNLYQFVGSNEIMVKLLELNGEYKLFKFCVNPADGEVYVQLDVILFDTVLNLEQLKQILHAMLDIALKEKLHMWEFQITGNYPETESQKIDNVVKHLLGNSPPFVDEDDNIVLLDGDEREVRENETPLEINKDKKKSKKRRSDRLILPE